MKRLYIFIILFFIPLTLSSAEADKDISFGVHFTAGVRYDDVRMCVGSDAGVKGGPIMDIYADLRYPLGDRDFLALNIPLMRPVLFGAAFQMLQFEPQLSYEHHFGPRELPHFVLGGGAGAVFHYGPDYESSLNDRGEEFYAWGPLFSAFIGREFPGERSNWMPGLKIFYSPLISDEYDNGSVYGAALELHFLMKP